MQGPGSLGIQSQIVISSGGPGTGLFLYNGNPGPGNKPILSATASTIDPYTNTVPKGFQVNGVPILVYSVLGANGMNASVQGPNTTTDIFGNTVQPGITSYLPGTPSTWTSLQAGQITFHQSGYVTNGSIFTDNLQALQLIGPGGGTGFEPATVIIQPHIVHIGHANLPSSGTTLAIDDPTTNGSGAFTSGAWAFIPQNQGGVGGSSTLQVLGVSGNTSTLQFNSGSVNQLTVLYQNCPVETNLFGDTTPRFTFDPNGKQQWGPGNAALDTDLYRSGPGALNTDGQFLAGGVVQTLAGMQILVNPTTNTVFEIATLLAANGRFDIDGNGKMSWGVGGATAVDTDLYRHGVGFLATDNVVTLGNQAATPASQAGFVLLYADTFNQLHTDKAFQTDDHIEIKNLGATPGAGGSGGKIWSHTGHINIVTAQIADGGDTLNYDVERLTLDLPADTATLSNTAATNIPGLATKTVQAQKYKLRARIMSKAGVAAGTITINFAGPAVSSGGMGGEVIDNSNTNNVNQTAGLGSIGYTQTNVGRTSVIKLEGVVTFSAAGVLSVQSRTSLAADTYTIQAGSYWELEPVVAT